MLALSLAALLGQGGFFDRAEVDFWGRPKAAPAAEPLWSDSTAPAPVRRLLESPGAETAKAYLEWQRRRLERLREAMAAVEAERREEAPSLLYFSRPGCRWCAKQELELEGLPVLRVPEGSPLWAEHRVDAVPTLVLGRRTFRGFTERAALLKELGRD